jgi:hypothetical protein
VSRYVPAIEPPKKRKPYRVEAWIRVAENGRVLSFHREKADADWYADSDKERVIRVRITEVRK